MSRYLTPLRCVFLLCALVASCESVTEVVAHDTYSASLSGAAVRPDTVETSGTGSFHITLASDTSVATYDLSFSGLSDVATSAHLHGPAQDTVAAGVLVDFAALPDGAAGTLQLGTSGQANGTIDLAKPVTAGVSGDSLKRLIIAGLLYVDVHTSAHSPEIRGQIKR
ncbi:MAG TPA: CHRD domain-containing protein [Gemmatimonadaceae bacterium]|nr:CHRD domain-containing protein [Gemmatimonadaceae bacterium]